MGSFSSGAAPAVAVGPVASCLELERKQACNAICRASAYAAATSMALSSDALLRYSPLQILSFTDTLSLETLLRNSPSKILSFYSLLRCSPQIRMRDASGTSWPKTPAPTGPSSSTSEFLSALIASRTNGKYVSSAVGGGGGVCWTSKV